MGNIDEADERKRNAHEEVGKKKGHKVEVDGIRSHLLGGEQGADEYARRHRAKDRKESPSPPDDNYDALIVRHVVVATAGAELGLVWPHGRLVGGGGGWSRERGVERREGRGRVLLCRESCVERGWGS
eukprot:scaffold66300_cov27-Tisochrysis_lutea.AAC.2